MMKLQTIIPDPKTESTLKIEVSGNCVWITNRYTQEVIQIVMGNKSYKTVTCYLTEGAKKPEITVLWGKNGKLVKREEY